MCGLRLRAMSDNALPLDGPPCAGPAGLVCVLASCLVLSRLVMVVRAPVYSLLAVVSCSVAVVSGLVPGPVPDLAESART